MQTVSRMHTTMAERPAPCLSIVVLVLNEQDSIRRFLSVTRPAIAWALEAAGSDAGAEFVFVDDGSSDNTFALLSRMAAECGDIRVIRLSRNFGKEAALAALGSADASTRGFCLRLSQSVFSSVRRRVENMFN